MPSTATKIATYCTPEHSGFFANIPYALLASDLSKNASILYGVLLSFCGKKSICWPRQSKLADIMNTSTRSIKQGVAELKRAGLVDVRLDTEFRQNKYVLPYRGNEMECFIKRPKQAKKTGKTHVEETEEGWGTNLPLQVKQSSLRNKTTNKTKEELDKSNSSSNLAPLDCDRLAETKTKILKTVEEAKQKSLASAAKKKTGFVKKQNFSALWENTYREVYGQSPVSWSRREIGMLKNLHKNYDEHARLPFSDFLDWVLRNWQPVIAVHFSWMTKNPAPEYPRIDFLLRFRDRFVDAWFGRNDQDYIKNLPERERRIKLMERKGVPTEEATAIVDRELAERKAENMRYDAAQKMMMQAAADKKAALVAQANTGKMLQRQNAGLNRIARQEANRIRTGKPVPDNGNFERGYIPDVNLPAFE